MITGVRTEVDRMTRDIRTLRGRVLGLEKPPDQQSPEQLALYIPCGSTDDVTLLNAMLAEHATFFNQSVSVIEPGKINLSRSCQLLFHEITIQVDSIVETGLTEMENLPVYLRNVLYHIIPKNVLANYSWSGQCADNTSAFCENPTKSFSELRALVNLLEGNSLNHFFAPQTCASVYESFALQMALAKQSSASRRKSGSNRC